ncbi:helix-turn-helix transcriptional regulator [Streptomyces sp. NPDC046909]|uniref:helix-turn-helix transcriptional regulator n=1 Tax=Streptomyces sp. NPDC046909 TaxID=3155617 RepID=UPI00340F1A1A
MASDRSPRRTELGEFLRAMRSRLQPVDVGLSDGSRRRTPGLRRQEVAQLAAVSIDWYIRLEQGRVGTPGAAVLDAVAQALRLTPPERRHLHLIARGETPLTRPPAAPVSDSLRVLLAGMPLIPAYIVDFRFDVLAHNNAAEALFGPNFGSGDSANFAQLMFLPPQIRETQLDWVRVARETVGNLRANLARHPDDPRLREVIAELRARSTEFAGWWDDHMVQQRIHGWKRILHPVAGELTLCYDYLATPDDSDQCLVAVTPADQATEDAIHRLMTGPGLHAVGA